MSAALPVPFPPQVANLHPVDAPLITGKYMKLLQGAHDNNPFDLSLRKLFWEEVQNLFPSKWENEIKGICEGDLSALNVYAFEDIKEDSVKYRIGKMIIATDIAAFKGIASKLSIESLDQRASLAHLYFIRTGSCDVLDGLNITSESDKKALFDKAYMGHFKNTFSLLKKLDITDRKWLHCVAKALIMEDLFSLGMMIRSPGDIRDLQSVCQIRSDFDRVSLGKAVLKKNPWALPIFLQNMTFTEPSQKVRLSIAWVNEMDLRRDPTYEGTTIDHNHEIRKPIRELLTGDAAVDLAFLETIAEQLPFVFLRNVLKLTSFESSDGINTLRIALRNLPEGSTLDLVSIYLKFTPENRESILRVLEQENPELHAKWDSALKEYQESISHVVPEAVF